MIVTPKIRKQIMLLGIRSKQALYIKYDFTIELNLHHLCEVHADLRVSP